MKDGVRRGRGILGRLALLGELFGGSQVNDNVLFSPWSYPGQYRERQKWNFDVRKAHLRKIKDRRRK